MNINDVPTDIATIMSLNRYCEIDECYQNADLILTFNSRRIIYLCDDHHQEWAESHSEKPHVEDATKAILTDSSVWLLKDEVESFNNVYKRLCKYKGGEVVVFYGSDLFIEITDEDNCLADGRIYSKKDAAALIIANIIETQKPTP